ncbi:MAG: phospho-N-acetylmuramoyl-pentapeptide-transferase [Candidatus Colwellbacteria bacterium]|nr:phospho-N-acetylmuramoyl-pentapeptide-transferase [Candidatus Colwellbacteria bacterium]
MALEAIRILGITVISFIAALTVTPVVHRLLLKYGVKKQIRTSESAPVFASLHAHKAGTPTMGGVIIWGTVLGVAAVFYLLSFVFDGFFDFLSFVNRGQTYLPLAAMFIAALIGFADDILNVLRIGPRGGGLSMRHRLLMYTVIGAVGAWWFYAPSNLGWNTLHIPFLGDLTIGAWYIPIFIFVMIASAFSANETDGLDGLLGGISLFIFGALGVVAFALGKYHLVAMIGATIGSLLAFLWFNIFPARFFMGDTGSMALGISIGTITMLTDTALFLPLFAFPFVIESLSVVIQLTSKKLFKKKIFISTPIHHHFEALGHPESQITMRFWIIAFISATLGVILFALDRIVG